MRVKVINKRPASVLQKKRVCAYASVFTDSRRQENSLENQMDCLNYVRELKDFWIGIIFEKENINTFNANGEVLLTILSSLAQDESRSISENCTWGIHRRFETGKHKMSTKRFLGYDTDENGKLVINRMQEPLWYGCIRNFWMEKQRITSSGFLKKREFGTGMAVRSGSPQP